MKGFFDENEIEMLTVGTSDLGVKAVKNPIAEARLSGKPDCKK